MLDSQENSERSAVHYNLQHLHEKMGLEEFGVHMKRQKASILLPYLQRPWSETECTTFRLFRLRKHS